jgi:hypothetical protein
MARVKPDLCGSRHRVSTVPGRASSRAPILSSGGRAGWLSQRGGRSGWRPRTLPGTVQYQHGPTLKNRRAPEARSAKVKASTDLVEQGHSFVGWDKCGGRKRGGGLTVGTPLPPLLPRGLWVSLQTWEGDRKGVFLSNREGDS